MPKAIVYDSAGNPAGVVSEFLDFGYQALHRRSNGAYEQARATIEAMAREHLLGLFALLAEHADVPGEVREMMQDFVNRYDEPADVPID